MKKDEKILVISRKNLFPDVAIQGFLPLTNFDEYHSLIARHQEFLWRSAMEEDPSYKQIIPYLVFRYKDTYFLMQRRSTASEVRLQNKHTLGIGGHIRAEDIQNNSLIHWAQREFNEEINYSGALCIAPLGLINDDSNPVGQVHVGFVFLLDGDSDTISIKSELKQGLLMTLEQMQPSYDSMETWSQIVYTYLLTMKNSQHKISHVDNVL